MPEKTSNRSKQPGALRGLSGKVLLLTIIFVMLGEVLIFLPSIANFRIQWLKGHIAQAEIAALAAEAAPDQILSSDLRSEILKGAGVLVVSLQKGESRKLALRSDGDYMIDASFDLRTTMWYGAIMDAFDAMLADENRVISVTDLPPNMSGDLIEIALHDEPLRIAMFRYGFNILLLSIFLSLLVAGMIFAALNWLLVKPMQRLTRNMVAFGQNPEDFSRIITPGSRRDEIGIAERELHGMQTELATMLQQKNHLAALGLAVSKVSHDLRNMLTSAQLISDRLSNVEDPTVKRFAPKLIGSLDRAIEFLSQTLKFGRAQELPPQREELDLSGLVDEVIDAGVVKNPNRIRMLNNVLPDVFVNADREHLNRVLTNLTRNAIQAIEFLQAERPDAPDGAIALQARREGNVTVIEVTDNGPGIPAQIRERLFQAFQSAARQGGTGLGLAIAAELIRAHGGDIHLERSTEAGTCFVITIPDQVTQLRTGRNGERWIPPGR
ncbi:MAG: HAMP domain-containing sensor histidine kinase [Aestuariivirga sp.]